MRSALVPMLVLAALAVTSGALGCSASPRSGRFVVNVSGDIASRVPATTVVIGLHRGVHCADEAFWSATVDRGSSPGMPPALDPGIYWVSVVAFDASCRVVGQACTVADLTTTSDVYVDLTPVDRACLDSIECAGCQPLDAASIEPADAAHVFPYDAVIPVIDAASDDAELPSMLDASLGDAGCTAVENNCMDGRDNDCNGAVDCDDPSCTSRPICGGCTAPCP